MATITQTGAIAIDTRSLDLSVLATLPLIGHFTDSLGWSNGAGTSALIKGSAIVSVVTGTTLTDVTAGTFQEVSIFIGGQILDLSGMTASAPQFFNLMQAANWVGLAKLAFAGNDTLQGSHGLHDTLMGWNGADFIDGGADHNILSGGQGADSLVANGGFDKLTGGAGADMFIFENTIEASTPVTIHDFHHGVDVLRINSFDFTNLGGPGALAAAHFHLGTSAVTAAQGIIYDQATGQLWADLDENGPRAQILIAHLGAGTVLDATDFLII